MYAPTLPLVSFLLTSITCLSNGLPAVRSLPPLTTPTLPQSKHALNNATDINAIIWPPVPFPVPLKARKGAQSIVITKNDRIDHGPAAHDLAKHVCALTIGYLQRLPPSTILDDEHWEHDSYGEGQHAVGFSIWVKLAPINIESSEVKLDREMMYFAMVEYCSLVAVFGAMQGEMEYWAWGARRAVVLMYIWPWPGSGDTAARES